MTQVRLFSIFWLAIICAAVCWIGLYLSWDWLRCLYAFRSESTWLTTPNRFTVSTCVIFVYQLFALVLLREFYLQVIGAVRYRDVRRFTQSLNKLYCAVQEAFNGTKQRAPEKFFQLSFAKLGATVATSMFMAGALRNIFR